jgi:hypothetical protein
MRESIEEGATKVQAFKELEAEYQYVSGVLTPAVQGGIQNALRSAVDKIEYADFRSGLRTSIEDQMLQVVTNLAVQDLTQSIIKSAFDQVGGLQDLMAEYFSGEIGLSELTTQFDQAMDAIESAMDEEEFQRFADVLEELGLIVDKTASEIESAGTQLAKVAGVEGEMIMGDMFQPFNDWLNSLNLNTVNELSNAYTDLNSLYREGTLSTEQYQYAISQLGEEFQKSADSILDYSKTLQTQTYEAVRGKDYMDQQKAKYFRQEYGIGPIEAINKAAATDFDPSTLNETDRENYEWALRYYEEVTEENNQTIDRNTNSTDRMTNALHEQQQLLQDQISNYKTIQSAIDNIMGGSQSTVQSAEWFDRRYNELLSGAQKNPEMIGDYTGFLDQYLDFFNEFGDPQQEDVLSDLRSLREDISGGRTLDDLYAQLEAVNVQLEDLRNVSGSTSNISYTGSSGSATSATDLLTGAVGDAFEGAKQSAFKRTIEPLLANTDFSTEDELEKAYKAAKSQGNWQETAEAFAGALGINPFIFQRDLKSYYGFADGGTIYGPTSGYTVPATFHGTEHITPDSQMQDVKQLLQQLISQQSSENPQHIHVHVGDQEIAEFVVNTLRNNPEAQHQVRRVSNG